MIFDTTEQLNVFIKKMIDQSEWSQSIIAAHLKKDRTYINRVLNTTEVGSFKLRKQILALMGITLTKNTKYEVSNA